MKKIIALLVAASVIAAMTCGCAKQQVEETEVKIVETTAASTDTIVINDEKPSETVERVPEEVKAQEPTKAAAQAEAGVAPETQKPAETAAPKAEGDLVSNDYSAYAGKYTRTEDGSTFELSKDGKVKISIIRLTEMEGKADGIYKNIIKMTVKDANDGDMKLEFLTDTNELVVTGSTWSLLPNGETFKFDKKE